MSKYKKVDMMFLRNVLESYRSTSSLGCSNERDVNTQDILHAGEPMFKLRMGAHTECYQFPTMIGLVTSSNFKYVSAENGTKFELDGRTKSILKDFGTYLSLLLKTPIQSEHLGKMLKIQDGKITINEQTIDYIPHPDVSYENTAGTGIQLSALDQHQVTGTAVALQLVELGSDPTYRFYLPLENEQDAPMWNSARDKILPHVTMFDLELKPVELKQPQWSITNAGIKLFEASRSLLTGGGYY